MAEIQTTCPACSRVHAVDDSVPFPKTYPFCSERCSLVDLSKWLDGSYAIERPIEERDLVD